MRHYRSDWDSQKEIERRRQIILQKHYRWADRNGTFHRNRLHNRQVWNVNQHASTVNQQTFQGHIEGTCNSRQVWNVNQFNQCSNTVNNQQIYQEHVERTYCSSFNSHTSNQYVDNRNISGRASQATTTMILTSSHPYEYESTCKQLSPQKYKFKQFKCEPHLLNEESIQKLRVVMNDGVNDQTRGSCLGTQIGRISDLSHDIRSQPDDIQLDQNNNRVNTKTTSQIDLETPVLHSGLTDFNSGRTNTYGYSVNRVDFVDESHYIPNRNIQHSIVPYRYSYHHSGVVVGSHYGTSTFNGSELNTDHQNQYMADFQRKPGNCSLKQAAVTRFSLKSDDVQDSSFNTDQFYDVNSMLDVDYRRVRFTHPGSEHTYQGLHDTSDDSNCFQNDTDMNSINKQNTQTTFHERPSCYRHLESPYMPSQVVQQYDTMPSNRVPNHGNPFKTLNSSQLIPRFTSSLVDANFGQMHHRKPLSAFHTRSSELVQHVPETRFTVEPTPRPCESRISQPVEVFSVGNKAACQNLQEMPYFESHCTEKVFHPGSSSTPLPTVCADRLNMDVNTDRLNTEVDILNTNDADTLMNEDNDNECQKRNLPISAEGRKVVYRREYHDTSKRLHDGRSGMKRQYPSETGQDNRLDGTSVRHVVLTPKRRRLEMYRPWSPVDHNSVETSGQPNKLSIHGENTAHRHDRLVNLTYKRKLETRTPKSDSNIMDLSCSDKSKEESGNKTKHLKTTEICEQKRNEYNGHGKQERSTLNKRKAVRDKDQLYKVSHVNLDIRAIKRTLGSSSKRTTDVQTSNSVVSSVAIPLVNDSPILSSCAERPVKTSSARKALFRAPGNDHSTVTDHQNASNLQKHGPTEPYKVKSALQKLIRNKQRAESKVKRQKELLKLVGRSIKMRKAQNVPQNKSSVSLGNVSNGLTELSPNMEDKSMVHPKLRHKIPKSSDEDFQEKLEESLGLISDQDIFGAKHVDTSDKTIEKSYFMKVFGLEVVNMTERKSPTENQRYGNDLNDAYIIDIENSHDLNTDENNNCNNENLKIQRTFSFDGNKNKEMRNNIDSLEASDEANFDEDCHVRSFGLNNLAEQAYNTQSPINTCYSVQALNGPMVSSTYFKEGTKDSRKSRVIRHAREDSIGYSNVDEYPHHTAAYGGLQDREGNLGSTENQQESPIVLPDLVIDTSSQKSSLDSSPIVNTLSIPHKETEFVDTRERRNDVKQGCYSTEDSDISTVNDDHAVGSSVSKCDSTDIMDGQNLSYDKNRAEQVANYPTRLQHETNQNLWLEMHVKYIQTKRELEDLDNHRAFLPPLPAFAPTSYTDPSHSDPGMSTYNDANISRFEATQEDFERYQYQQHQKQQHVKFASPVSYDYRLDNHTLQDHSPFCLQPTNDVASRQNPSCSSLPSTRNIVSVPSLYNCDSTTQTYDEMINDVSSTVMFESNIVRDLDQVIEEVVSNTCDNPGSPDLINLVTGLETLSEERLDYNGTGNVKPEIPKYRYNDDLDSEIDNPHVRQNFEQLCHGITHRHRYSKRLPSFYSRTKHDKHAHEMELFKAANKFLGDFDGSHKRACRKEIKEATVTDQNDEKEKDENVKIMKQKASQTDSRKSIAKALHTIAERKRMKNGRGRKKLNNAEEENKREEKNETPDTIEKLKMSELLKKCKTKMTNFNKRFSKHGKMFSMRAHFDKNSRQKFVKKDDKIDKTLFIKVETLKGEEAMMASNKGANETRKDDKSTQNKTGKDDKPMEKNQSLLSSSATSAVSTSNQSSAAAAVTSAASTSIPKPGVPCKVCNVLLDRDEKKQDEHYQKYHKGWCKKCQKDFGDNVQRKLHVRRNHDIRIFCGLCGVTFLYRGSYIKHTKCQMHIENCKKFPNNQQKTELEKPTPQPNPDLNESVISISSETSTEDLSIHYISSCSEDVLISPEKPKQVKQDRKDEKTVKGLREKMVAAKENKVSKLPVEKKATKKVKKVNKVSSGPEDAKKGDDGQEESKTVKKQTDELKAPGSKASRSEKWQSRKPQYCETCDHFYKKLKQHKETEKHIKTLAQKKKEMRLKKKEEKLRRQEMEGSQMKEKKPSLKQGKSGKGQMTNTNKKLRIRKYIYRHRCPHCDKLLPDLWKLDAHVRSHTGDTPYKCDVCVKSYKVKRSLEAHYIRHHSNMQLENDRNKEK